MGAKYLMWYYEKNQHRFCHNMILFVYAGHDAGVQHPPEVHANDLQGFVRAHKLHACVRVTVCVCVCVHVACTRATCAMNYGIRHNNRPWLTLDGSMIWGGWQHRSNNTLKILF